MPIQTLSGSGFRISYKPGDTKLTYATNRRELAGMGWDFKTSPEEAAAKFADLSRMSEAELWNYCVTQAAIPEFEESLTRPITIEEFAAKYGNSLEWIK